MVVFSLAQIMPSVCRQRFISLLLQAFRISLSAAGHYLVVKFTPMSPDGEAGEPAYAISEKVVDSKLHGLYGCFIFLNNLLAKTKP